MTEHTPHLNDPRLQARLRRMARAVRALILVGVAVVVGATIYSWSSPERALDQIRRVTSVCELEHLPAQAQMAGALWTLLPTALVLLALQRLWRLFGEYGQARVFSPRALLGLRGFARCLLAMALVSPVYGAVLSVIATWMNGPGKRQLNVSVSSDEYAMLLVGAVLLAISSVMAEAARVAEDNAGFV